MSREKLALANEIFNNIICFYDVFLVLQGYCVKIVSSSIAFFKISEQDKTVPGYPLYCVVFIDSFVILYFLQAVPAAGKFLRNPPEIIFH